MPSLLTSKQVAQALGVSESSVKRWCDQGAIPVYRTAGGHRRVPAAGVVQFVRQTQHPLADPGLLGMPGQAGGGRFRFHPTESVELAASALARGDEALVRHICLDLYLSPMPLVRLFDELLSPAFGQLGQGWCERSVAVYQERRACEICMRLLHELRAMLPPAPESAPLAIGGTLAGDPYTLPATMAELVLREAGWDAVLQGCGLPASTLARAIEDQRPRLLWLSVSAVCNPEDFVRDYRDIHNTALRLGTGVALGGRGLTPELHARLEASIRGDRLARLDEAARLIYATSPSAAQG